MKNYINKKGRFNFSRFFLLVILFLFSARFSAQTRLDSLEYLGKSFQIDLLSSRFNKQLNTFYLNSQLQYFNSNDDFSMRINENYGSTFIRSDNKSTRDEQHLNINTKYLFKKDISFGLLGNSSILSDNRSLGINESAVNYATLYSEIKPQKSITLAPFGGYSSNRQIGKTDNGFVYGFEGKLDNLFLSDVILNSEIRYRNEDILPRRNLIRSFGFVVANNFEKYVSNTIITGFSQSGKDFYINSDSVLSDHFNIDKNIQNRTETAYLIQDKLFYDQFLGIFSLDLTGGINWRRIDRNARYRLVNLVSSSDYDTRIEELKMEIDAVTKYSSKFLNTILRINYYERDEKNAPKRFEGISDIIFDQQTEKETQKNNNSTRATISFSGNIKFSEKDIVSFSLYQSKLKYDTPSILNDDDRDELLSIVRLGYLSKLTYNFSAFVNLEGTYGHTVYLFASKSSNNNKNRIIRLRTGGDYYGSVISSFNSFEVSANYTVYDYEDLSANYQSYSFRQFTAVDSTTIRLIKNLSLYNYGYVKLSEIGDFRWNNFTSHPKRFLKEIYLEPRFVLNLNNSLFSVGLRIFLLDTYGYSKKIKILESDYLSFGPIALIDLALWQKLDISFKGYYEFISNTNIPDKEQASLSMQVNWKF